MNTVATFEKVSLPAFEEEAVQVIRYNGGYYADDYMNEVIEEIYDEIKTPKRATTGSAGYDFFTPFGFTIHPGETIFIPTGIRTKIDDGWCLLLMPKSGLGFKYSVKLCNTIGLIDSDYYYSDNEGHIMAKFKNEGDRMLSLKRGDKFMQGIFVPFGITEDDSTTGTRNGGFGSTGK